MAANPNKLELFLTAIIVILGALMTGTIFPILISTDKMPVELIVIIFVFMLVIMIIGLQSVANIFYVRWQRKQKKDKNNGF